MKGINSLLCILVLLLVFSCTKDPKKSTTEEEVTFKLENLAARGWKSKRVNQYIGDITYSATDVPISYYILKTEGISDLKKVDSIIKQNSKERVVEIEFSHIDSKDLLKEEFTKMNYEESVKYMAFKLDKDFKVVTSSNDTISCLGVQFERNFKVAPFKRAMLYFNGIPEDEQIQLIYNDQLFGNGIVKFNFKNKNRLDN